MDAPRHLPRLSPEHYRGRASVHWTLTVAKRGTGWLTPRFHVGWKLVLLHACARYRLVCPAYVLMPDHAHVLLCGVAETSDQARGVAFLRRHLKAVLIPHEWQRQVHDHVLQGHERERGAFAAIAHYILENPVRAGLAGSWLNWSYLGCCAVGYPELNVRAEDHWERFWRLYNFVVERGDR